MAKNFKVKLRNGTKDTIVNFTRNEEFKDSDKIFKLEEALEEALGNKRLKEAYDLTNNKKYSLKSTQTFKKCFPQGVAALNNSDTSLVAFVPKINFKVKLKKGKTYTTVEFTRDEEFKNSDKISELEEALKKALENKKLKAAYGLKNDTTYSLNSDKTLENCFGSQGAGLLNNNETRLIAFIPEE